MIKRDRGDGLVPVVLVLRTQEDIMPQARIRQQQKKPSAPDILLDVKRKDIPPRTYFSRKFKKSFSDGHTFAGNSKRASFPDILFQRVYQGSLHAGPHRTSMEYRKTNTEIRSVCSQGATNAHARLNKPRPWMLFPMGVYGLRKVGQQSAETSSSTAQQFVRL